jgi:cytochrome c-type biogenesis protein CcmH/NrfG
MAIQTAIWVMLNCEPENLRRPQRALELVTKVMKATDESDYRVLRLLAQAQFANGLQEQAVETMRLCLKGMPPDHHERTEMIERLEKYQAALR